MSQVRVSLRDLSSLEMASCQLGSRMAVSKEDGSLILDICKLKNLCE